MKDKIEIKMAEPNFSSSDKKRILDEVEKILSSQLSMGENVRLFEKEFSNMVGTRHCVASNSCTSSLETALQVLGASTDDEVIVPTQTFIATGMAVKLVGAKPVFCEINPRDFSIDFNAMKNVLNKRTKGVILVHFSGYISDDIFKIKKFCEENNLFLIEDASHAPGAIIDGKLSGSIGDIGCFSLYPTKIITSGEGGMLTTDNDQIAQQAVSLQNRGRDMQSDTEEYSLVGRNIRMTEMCAITGRVQLSSLESYLSQRRKIGKYYKESLNEIQEIVAVAPFNDKQSSYWKFPIILEDSINRHHFLAELHKKGVFADLTYQPPLHLQPVFKKLYGTKEGDLKQSENIMTRHVCLPCHQSMTLKDAEYVMNQVKKILK